MATKKKAAVKKKATARKKRAAVAKTDTISLKKLGYDRAQIAKFQEECEALGISAAKAFWLDLDKRYKALSRKYGELEVSEAEGFCGHLTTQYGTDPISAKDLRREMIEKVHEERRELSNMMAKVMSYIMPQKRAVEADVRAQVVSLVDVLKQVADD